MWSYIFNKFFDLFHIAWAAGCTFVIPHYVYLKEGYTSCVFTVRHLRFFLQFFEVHLIHWRHSNFSATVVPTFFHFLKPLNMLMHHLITSVGMHNIHSTFLLLLPSMQLANKVQTSSAFKANGFQGFPSKLYIG